MSNHLSQEITGSSVLQPNSPQSIVQTALESANKSRLLARRLFYSFAKPNADYLLVEDIQGLFKSRDEADLVFAIFDQDSNGDASRDEVEMAIMCALPPFNFYSSSQGRIRDLHREQLSIEHSMQDLDSAVGRLDNIFMSLYVPIFISTISISTHPSIGGRCYSHYRSRA